MSNPVPAAIAFFAFGALFAGTALLLLINSRSREIRWWTLFQTANLLWLGLQGWAFATESWDALAPLIGGVVHLMPAIFFAFALVGYGRPDRDALLAVAVGLITLPIDWLLQNRGFAELFLLVWYIGGWGGATLLLVRARWGKSWGPEIDRRLGYAVVGLLVMIAPLALVGGVLFGRSMWVYAMPLLVVWIQFLVFVGVTRLRFYDIEVRTRRTGELAAEAAEQERLATVGELSASLAHEIRNPLTGVRSLAQRLADDEVPEERRRRYAGVILEEVGRVERLVTNLLGIARRAPPHPNGASATPLEPLFDDLLLLVGSRAAKADVRLTTEDNGLVAHTPREPLAQALLNLLLNAIAHSPAGGYVDLRAREAGDGSIELLLRDMGPGIAPGDRERIWEPFFSRAGGTGLGLAVVRRLAREHGWALEVGDAPGGGAEFRLRIPAARQDAPATYHPRATHG